MRGNLAPLEDAVAIWEQASGLKADPDALKWWRLFSVVKGQGIWASSAMAWRSGATPELMLALTAWACVNTQDREALELMGRL
jgi:aminoglycoside phosphotransferase (APT) family kinase protein